MSTMQTYSKLQRARKSNILNLITYFDSQEVLGDAIGMTQQGVSRVLNNRNGISERFCRKVEKKLGLDAFSLDESDFVRKWVRSKAPFSDLEKKEVEMKIARMDVLDEVAKFLPLTKYPQNALEETNAQNHTSGNLSELDSKKKDPKAQEVVTEILGQTDGWLSILVKVRVEHSHIGAGGRG